MSLAKKAEKKLVKESRLKGLVTPQYDGLSVPNTINSVLQGFNAPHRDSLDPEFFDPSIMKGIKNVVFLCIDGFGYNLLDKAKFMKKLEGFPITSVMPSTTTAALASLATGLTPQEHGILGFRMMLRELGHVTSMLRFGPSMSFGSFADEGIDPGIFFPSQTVYSSLKRKGVKPFVINKYDFVDSPLSEMIYKGGEVVPYVNVPDMFLKTQKILKKPGKKFIYMYWEMIDTVSHMYGTKSEELAGEIKLLDSQLDEFLSSSKAKDTLFMLTADHGQINTSTRSTIDMREHTQLLDLLKSPPGGEARMLYMYSRKTKKSQIQDYYKKHLSKKAFLLDSRELLEQGYFGTGKPLEETPHRMGDFVLLPKKNYAFSYPFLDSRHSKGRHGGLSKEEMLVPFLWKRM